MKMNKGIEWVIEHRSNSSPLIIYPSGTDTSDWVEFSTIGDEYAKFMRKNKSGLIDCGDFYRDYLNYISGN